MRHRAIVTADGDRDPVVEGKPDAMTLEGALWHRGPGVLA